MYSGIEHTLQQTIKRGRINSLCLYTTKRPISVHKLGNCKIKINWFIAYDYIYFRF